MIQQPALLTFKDWLDANGYVYRLDERASSLHVPYDGNEAKAYAADAYSRYARNWHKAERARQ